MINKLDLGGVWRLTFTDHQRFGHAATVEKDLVDEDRFIDAKVPGEVHLDCWRAGIIEDPYFGINHLKARWVEECEWSYRRWIDVPAVAISGRAWLNFECLDLVARVILNGVEVGRHANSFSPCRIEVTGKLKVGPNLLVVHIESGLFDSAEKPTSGYDNALDGRLNKRIWLRKPQSQAGWDWSPRLYNVGIQGPAHLEWTQDTVRLQQIVPLATVSEDLQTGTLRARVFVEGLREVVTLAKMQISLPTSGVTTEVSIEVKPGLHAYEAILSVLRPNLWWPVGHGRQPLESVIATLTVDGIEVGKEERRIGWRRVVIDQSKHPRTGKYFVVEVNGRKIFCKGGNFVPADLILANIDRQRYKKLIDLALEANFNLLRVWGGGLYESEDFYDLCDEHGILVWQEFIFACGRYPGTDETFRNSVREEAIHNIRRLAAHPSLFAWCGNNENEWGYWDWGFDKGPQVLPDHAIYHHLFPRLLAVEDPTRWYQPSSPYSSDQLHPNRDDIGDQHPWSIGFAELDYRKYRTMECRFPNEGGYLGTNSLATLISSLPETDRRPHSLAWRAHDNSIGSKSATDNIPELWLGKKLREMSLEDSCYYLGLVQGEALREYCENFHRRMFDCSAAIFWMFNDCWPSTRSWTIVDHGLRRTPAFHSVRRALASVALVVVENSEEVVIYGINEGREEIVGDLRYGIFCIAGSWPIDRKAQVKLAPNASVPLARFPRTEWRDPHSEIAAAMLSVNGNLIARARLILPTYVELTWAPATPRIELTAGIATFSSDTFAWGVCLDLNGERQLSDNFFDIYPGVPYRIPWLEQSAPRILRLGNLNKNEKIN